MLNDCSCQAAKTLKIKGGASGGRTCVRLYIQLYCLITKLTYSLRRPSRPIIGPAKGRLYGTSGKIRTLLRGGSFPTLGNRLLLILVIDNTSNSPCLS